MSITLFKNKTYRLLRKGEKYTKTDNIYLAKGSFWLGLSQFVFFFTSFISSICFANFLPKEVYGAYKCVLSYLAILSIPMMGSLNTSLTQAIARGFDGSYLKILKLKIKLGLIGSTAALCFSGYYFFQQNTSLALAFAAVALFLPIFNNLNIYTDFLQGRRLFKYSSLYNIVKQIILLLSIIITLILTNNLLVVLFIHFFFRALLNLIFFKHSLKKFPPNSKEDSQTIPYGLQLSLLGIVQKISLHIDQILLWHFLGAVEIAVYNFAILPVVILKSLVGGNISTLAFPKLSRRDTQTIKKTLPAKIRRYFLIIVPLLVLYILIVPFFFKIFYPAYLEAIPYSRLFALSLLFLPFSIMGDTLIAKMKKKEITIIRFFSPSIKIILLLTLTPLYGILGVIIALLTSSLLHVLVLSFLFKKMKT